MQLNGLQLPPCWTVGNILGTGACSVGVYALKRTDGCKGGPNWCVKFAIEPPPRKKGSKKKRTEEERFADLIYHEYQLYSGTLNAGRGVWCADLPDIRERPYGTVTTKSNVTLRYLILEQIAHPLYHSCSTPSQIISRTVDVVGALSSLHGTGLVMVDVKKDNCRVDSKGNVRILDFGCAERYKTVSGNPRTASGGGTPAYWSRAVSEGNPCNPADDIESCVYMCHEEIDGALKWDDLDDEEEMKVSKRDFAMGEVGDDVREGLEAWGKRIGKSKGGSKNRKTSPKKTSPKRKSPRKKAATSSPARRKKQEVIDLISSDDDEEMVDASDSEDEPYAPPHLTLVVESGPDAGASIIVFTKTTIHRHPGPKTNTKRKVAVATLHDSECSTKHCTVSLVAGRVLSLEVKDENSTNGTFVNGKKVASKKMCFVGDKVRIGSNVMRITPD